MPAPKKPNTEAGRAALAAKREAEKQEAEKAAAMAYLRNYAMDKGDPELSTLVATVDRYLFPVDLAELTKRLGLPDHEQQAVLSFSGEEPGHIWTEDEADDLIQAWRLEGLRIAYES